MTCATCIHHFPARWDHTDSCMSLTAAVKLLDQPSRCPEFREDAAKVEAERQAAVREQERARQPVRTPERWISEQTEMNLQRRILPDYHDR